MTWTDLKTRLDDAGYVASDELAMAIHIALQLERPILLEGDAGVGKTQIAKTLAEIEGTELIRLQCYEGLDAAASIYEWNYQRQLLSIRASADPAPRQAILKTASSRASSFSSGRFFAPSSRNARRCC